MRERRPKPKPWREHCQHPSSRWAYPFRKSNWALEWVAWCLGGWVLLEVLEYLSMFSVLVAVIFYFSETGVRTMQRHYQAWQVINSAQGKHGHGHSFHGNEMRGGYENHGGDHGGHGGHGH